MNKKLISAPDIKITSVSISPECAAVLKALKFNKARWYRIPSFISFVLHTKEHGDIQFNVFGDFYFDGRSGPWCVDWFEPNLGPLNKRLAWLVHDLLGYATYFDFSTTNEILRQLLIIAGDSKIKASTVRYFVGRDDSWFGVPVVGDKFYPNIGKFEIKRIA